MTAKVITHKWIIGRRECRLKTEIAMTKQVMFCQSLSFWNFLFRTIETLLIKGVVIFTESLIKINIFLHSTFGNDRYVKFYSTTRGFSLIAYAKTKQKSFYDKKSRSRKLEVDHKVLVLLPTHQNYFYFILCMFCFLFVLFFVCFWCQELWLFYVHFFHLFFFLVKYLILLMFCFIMYWPTDNSDILRLYKIKENSAFSPLKMYMKLKKIYFRMLFDICPEQ
jgi:uncharacterized membrane protein YedE/YeeE